VAGMQHVDSSCRAAFVASQVKAFDQPLNVVHIFNHLFSNHWQLHFHTYDYWLFHIHIAYPTSCRDYAIYIFSK